MEIENKKMKEKIERLTLGRLIDYCFKNDIISKEVYKVAKKINLLRNLAIHLRIEKEQPMKVMETIQGIDEEVSLRAFKKPPVIVSKEGWISGYDVNFIWRPGFLGVRYKYKKAANRTFKNVRFILRTLYSIKFNVED